MAEIEVYYMRQQMPPTVNIYDQIELQQTEGKQVQITFCPFIVSGIPAQAYSVCPS